MPHGTEGVRAVKPRRLDLTPQQLALVNDAMRPDAYGNTLVGRVLRRLESSRSGSGYYVRLLGDEAESVGNLALLSAARWYDPGRAKFFTYASKVIVRAVLRRAAEVYGANGSKLPVSLDGCRLDLPDVTSDPAEAAVRAEEEAAVERALPGGFPGGGHDRERVQRAAKRLGLNAGGSVEAIVGRVADSLRPGVSTNGGM
jgi:hypothetical protein